MSDGIVWYDTQRVCLRGHQLETSVGPAEDHEEVFCSECGERSITCCQNCKDPIRGRKNSFDGVMEIIGSRPEIPKCCHKCGKPYPWNEIVENDLEGGFASIVIRPEIRKHVEKYMKNKDYFHATEEAYKVVRSKLRKLTTKEKATDVFNCNAESEKYYEQLFGKIRPDSDAEKDFFRGIGHIHLAIQFLRNEKAHTLAGEIDKNLAVHYIALASLAYTLVSRSSAEN